MTGMCIPGEVRINHSNQKRPLSSNHVLGDEVIFQPDKLKLWEKAPMIAKVVQVGWGRLWVSALIFRGKTVRGFQTLRRVMHHHGRGS